MPTYLLSEDELVNTPSVKAGVDREVEVNNTVFTCELISQAGIMLRLPQVAISTAQIILHRFYHRKSMKAFKCLRVAMTAIFIASKVEECSRKAKDIMNVFDRLIKKRHGLPVTVLDTASQRYGKWRNQLKATELNVLKELGYVLYVDHPHKFFLHYINCLNATAEVAQRAWNFLNDSMRLDLCLRYRPEVVATASIFLSARLVAVKLPDNPPWYDLFDAKLEDIEDICSRISELYTRPKLKYIPVDSEDHCELIEPEPSAVAAAAASVVEETSTSSAATETQESTDKGTQDKVVKSERQTSSGSSVKKEDRKKDRDRDMHPPSSRDKRDSSRDRDKSGTSARRKEEPLKRSNSRRELSPKRSRRRKSRSRSYSSSSRSSSYTDSSGSSSDYTSSSSRSRSRSRSHSRRRKPAKRDPNLDSFGRVKAKGEGQPERPSKEGASIKKDSSSNRSGNNGKTDEKAKKKARTDSPHKKSSKDGSSANEGSNKEAGEVKKEAKSSDKSSEKKHKKRHDKEKGQKSSSSKPDSSSASSASSSSSSSSKSSGKSSSKKERVEKNDASEKSERNEKGDRHDKADKHKSKSGSEKPKKSEGDKEKKHHS